MAQAQDKKTEIEITPETLQAAAETLADSGRLIEDFQFGDRELVRQVLQAGLSRWRNKWPQPLCGG